VIFCHNLLFYFWGVFIARCILQGNVMALVLNHSLKKENQHGKILDRIEYISNCKVMLSFGGNRLIIRR
jgi:hypothetical protein